MTNIIKTDSVSKDFVKSSGVLLEQTADTALVFFPEIHSGGVRGHLVRFKKTRNEQWEKIPESDFRKLKLNEGVYIELRTNSLKKLVMETNKREMISKEGVKSGHAEYTFTEREDVLIVDDKNVKIILEQVLRQGYSGEFWDLVKNSNPDLADKLSAGHLQFQRRQNIDILKKRMDLPIPETAGNDSWQAWIYTHNWLFGANYQKPIEKQKINIAGTMPDFLFPTVDGFVDILEIKLPSFEVIEEDKNHKGSWYWSKETNHAIGQVVTYLNEIDRLRLEIEREIKIKYHKEVSMLKPRGYILIGKNTEWSKEKMEGLRKLNHSLHGIEVLTYADLVKRGETFIESASE